MSNTPRSRLSPKPQTVSASRSRGWTRPQNRNPRPPRRPNPSRPKAAQGKPNEAERAAKIAAAEWRNRLEQWAAIERRAAIRDAQLAVLRERFPAVFNDERPLPLALGVDKHLRVLLGASVRTTLRWWVSQPAYLTAVAAGGLRYGLGGEAVGPISEAHASLAAAQPRGRPRDRRVIAGRESGPPSPLPHRPDTPPGAAVRPTQRTCGCTR
jgi:hypothetical protein